jgi:hypothetical protein
MTKERFHGLKKEMSIHEVANQVGHASTQTLYQKQTDENDGADTTGVEEERTAC